MAAHLEHVRQTVEQAVGLAFQQAIPANVPQANQLVYAIKFHPQDAQELQQASASVLLTRQTVDPNNQFNWTLKCLEDQQHDFILHATCWWAEA